MSKLSVDQKTIKDLLQDKNSNFLIPDYQRPYSWGEDECQTLWEDIISFALPDNKAELFDDNEEYFLGAIVVFRNKENKLLEVIDGQQRLTTIMLLLRAFYQKFEKEESQNAKNIRDAISLCLWQADEFGNANLDKLKIDSLVATDKSKQEFLSILKTATVEKEQRSKYAINFKFFQDEISKFHKDNPTNFLYLPNRIIKNCVLLPIEADTQDTALRIFSTLNDRGMPLGDSDIFKAQFYQYYKDEKDDFIKRWDNLVLLCEDCFKQKSGAAIDELFTRYMYVLRSSQKQNKTNTTEGLRKFYEKDGYKAIKNDRIFNELELLADFWSSVAKQDRQRFSQDVLKSLLILRYAPNNMWTYFVSVYFMKQKDENNTINNNLFNQFLQKTIAFVWTNAVINPGVSSLRTPIFAEMIKITENKPVDFEGHKFDKNQVLTYFDNYNFSNSRAITKSMLIWWEYYTHKDQDLFDANENFDIEHIYAKNNGFVKLWDSIGNKILLEKSINIRAADYKFVDKKKYYTGYIDNQQYYTGEYIDSKGKKIKSSKILEFRELVQKNDFNNEDITQRKAKIIQSFVDFLQEQDLLKK